MQTPKALLDRWDDLSGYRIIPEPNSGCWLWLGGISERGYGRVAHNGKQYSAHRVSYEATFGAVPDGLVIDHLCRVHGCVNPHHLEVVTQRENIFRGRSPLATAIRNKIIFGHARKPDCSRGHAKIFGALRRGTKMMICLDCKRVNNLARSERRRRYSPICEAA